MKCPVCDTQASYNTKFCTVCGNALDNQTNESKGATQQNVIVEPNNFGDVNFRQAKIPVSQTPPVRINQQNINNPPNTFSGFTPVMNDEHEIARLSNGTVTNLISGEGFKTEGAILTNKRLYYNHKSGIVNVRTQEEIVDVKDITGTKIANVNPWGILVLAALALLLGILDNDAFIFFIIMIALALVLLISFFVIRKSHLKVEYAGGSIYFSVKKYGKENVAKFQKFIHVAKDNIESNKS